LLAGAAGALQDEGIGGKEDGCPFGWVTCVGSEAAGKGVFGDSGAELIEAA
jgi:hypothetical protein